MLCVRSYHVQKLSNNSFYLNEIYADVITVKTYVNGGKGSNRCFFTKNFKKILKRTVSEVRNGGRCGYHYALSRSFSYQIVSHV